MAEALLLPSNATPLERALDGTEGRMLDIPAPLADLWSPDRCPAPLLPYLAWALSADLWEDDWGEGRRRRMCREAIERRWDAGGRSSIAAGSHGLEVLSAVPERVLERGPGPARAMFVGRAVGGFIARNDAVVLRGHPVRH